MARITVTEHKELEAAYIKLLAAYMKLKRQCSIEPKQRKDSHGFL